ncbi:MAG: class D sortase [Candidatus Sulfotelmatobacter sp.]|jgi:sortase A
METRPKRILALGQCVLLAVGLSALGYCAVTIVAAKRYQAWAREQTQDGNSEPVASSPSSSQAVSRPSQFLPDNGMPVIGKVDIPRLHISVMVAQGTSPQTLRVAAGHIPGTALPGQTGNVVIAAHRDTFFRRLGELKSGDLICITVPGKQYLYNVKFTDVVSPTETWVLEPSSNQSLTLVTCYPFYYIGPAPKRFVVRARRIDRD